MERLLLKPEEAAEMLGIGRSKVYALLAAGELPRVMVGHSVRVPASALERWVKERLVVRPGQEEASSDGAPGGRP
jgi:excisionase family DNA binding protein